MLLSPDSLFLLLLAAGWGLLRAGREKAGRRLIGFLLASLCCLALFPVDEWLMHPIESRITAKPVLPADVDGIIMLGGAEQTQRSRAWGQPALGEAGERYMAFLELAHAYPEAKLVFSGGSGQLLGQELKEADIAADVLRRQGLETSRVQFESASRNTAENALRTVQGARPTQGERWILVTSAFHMPRAMGGFCRAGLAVIPYPVDQRSEPGRLLRLELDLAGHLLRTRDAMSEWVGLVVYYLLGRTNALLPQSCELA